MAQSLTKTSNIITGMGGRLLVEYLGNSTAKVTIIINDRPLELISGSSMGKIEATAETLLNKAKKPGAPLSEEERLINEAFPS